ncbi:7-carboxy-7-deazaguanine synthase QueE [Cytobacillus sp. FSL W7-1323]|uniref:7-carboxy-7-deazaguanine synthase n=1 Tax=Cytobacillus kochii TaxID=859143 RepID=A0A248TER1_9BACI|nr:MULTISPECIES: 7-carboxy-7-deazaguanine synthase QueE [Cytobacillus]ASV66656.1 7-carboxy-7-deazaguanine synthase QueE [Cytobacillus kochii]MEA1854192.1 7-carboxy-7-deazaguanine synthase QueE [Cytobacillus sp. OWB-43]MED1607189.1 7-carboxy-7-deazaguanine synthase QueE [Cytobacillus kochii]
MSKIPVMEIFGPTIQGEGIVIGQKTMFVRTAGCDYACTWCDSSFTWDGSSKHLIKQMTATEIWHELKNIGGDYFDFVTISGGNPALLKNLGELVTLLKDKKVQTALETQGSKWQDWFKDIDFLTLSPKPPSSQMETDFNKLDEIIAQLEEKQPNLKVVVFNEEDLAYAKKVHLRYPKLSFCLQVGNDDSMTTNNDVLRSNLLAKYEWLLEKTMHDSEFKNIRVLPQLHTYIWGNKRGV